MAAADLPGNVHDDRVPALTRGLAAVLAAVIALYLRMETRVAQPAAGAS